MRSKNRPAWIQLAVTAALAGASGLLAGCDPPPADELILGPRETAAFAVERLTPARGALPADGSIVVRFTRDIDPRSVGARSVRLTRPDGRRPVRARVWADGRDLFVAAVPGRTLPSGESLLLKIDGAPSPRSLRAANGDPLRHAFDAIVRVGPARGDFRGPRLVGSVPSDGADDAAPGSVVELRFSEPLARGAVVSGDAATLRVDGRAVPARLEISGDRTTIVVRPSSPLPPNHRAEIEIHRCLLDLAGNALDAGSARAVSFRTRADSLHELAEDFVDSGNADVRVTSCGWDDPETPGALVAKDGQILVGPGAEGARLDLGESSTVRFQVVLRGSETPDGLASALRIELTGALEGAQVRSAVVEAGPTSLETREPSFAANRAASDLRPVARVSDPIDAEVAETGAAAVEVVFDEPLRLAAGHPLLLDVRLELTAGTRVSAFADANLSCLVEGQDGVAPAAYLLVSPASPQAVSLWYDTGVDVPGWRSCVLDGTRDGGVRVRTQFQSAPAGEDGRPDPSLASSWEDDLADLPGFRFVRFRVRFEGTPESGVAPRIDRIVLPYEQ